MILLLLLSLTKAPPLIVRFIGCSSRTRRSLSIGPRNQEYIEEFRSSVMCECCCYYDATITENRTHQKLFRFLYCVIRTSVFPTIVDLKEKI